MSTPLSEQTFIRLDDPDPATPGNPLERLRYHYGQLLGAEDFSTEQRYFLLRRRLHNALLHGVGTVIGLRVVEREGLDPDANTLMLDCEPGMAIDALGREVIVPERVCLEITGLASTPFWADLSPPPVPDASVEAPVDPGDAVDPVEADVVDPAAPPDPPPETAVRRVHVVLSYRACLSEPVPAVVPPCTDGDAGLVHSRVRDSYQLCLAAEPPPDPAATQRDITAVTVPVEPRARVLDFILGTAGNPPVGLARFWSGQDSAPLLLATLDLEPVGDPPVRVRLVGAVDNAVRAILPPVQAIASMALGVRLDGASGPAAFQVTGVGVDPGPAPDTMTLVVGTTAEPEQATLTGQSVRVWGLDPGVGWSERPVSARAAETEGIRITVDESWDAALTYQVCLTGTGAQAIVDIAGRLLAGVAGESVPTGSGRDVCLGARYEPA